LERHKQTQWDERVNKAATGAASWKKFNRKYADDFEPKRGEGSFKKKRKRKDWERLGVE